MFLRTARSVASHVAVNQIGSALTTDVANSWVILDLVRMRLRDAFSGS